MATSRPSVVTAWWTWAMEAAPTGSGIDRGEELLDRTAEAGLDRRLDRREGLGRQVVLELEQVRRRRLADEIGAGGERLAELDRGRADLLHRRGIIDLAGHAQAEARDAAQPADVGRRQRVALDALQGAMPRQRPAPFEEAPEMDGGGGQIFHPLQMQTSPPSIGSTLALAKPASAIIRRKASGLGKRRIDSTR